MDDFEAAAHDSRRRALAFDAPTGDDDDMTDTTTDTPAPTAQAPRFVRPDPDHPEHVLVDGLSEPIPVLVLDLTDDAPFEAYVFACAEEFGIGVAVPHDPQKSITGFLFHKNDMDNMEDFGKRKWYVNESSGMLMSWVPDKPLCHPGFVNNPEKLAQTQQILDLLADMDLSAFVETFPIPNAEILCGMFASAERTKFAWFS